MRKWWKRGNSHSINNHSDTSIYIYCSFDRFHLYTGSSSPLYKEGLLQRMNNEMFNTLMMTASGGNQNKGGTELYSMG